MKPLEDYPDWKRKVAGRQILLMLDFDGTLSPIVDNAEAAVLPMETKFVVARLAAWPHVTVAVISGRALVDLKARVGLNRVIYAGNHGLEITGLQQAFGNPVPPEAQLAVREIADALNVQLQDINGAWVEDKGLTISTHYRQAAPEDQPRVKELVHAAAVPFIEQGKVVIREGKMVLEVRPSVRWGKGEAVTWILNHMPRGSMAIYIGDDETDEDAFKALLYRGMTVRVGQKEDTAAEYFVEGTEGVLLLLKQLLASLDR